MSTPTPSPFLPPGRPRARRRPRRRWAPRVGSGLVLVLALAALLLTIGPLRSGHRAGHTSARAVAGLRSSLAGSPAHSAGAGEASGAAPLPLQLQFHHPPRAGLLFDLDTGKVLWALNPTAVLPVASLAKMMTALLVVRRAPADAQVLVTRRAHDTAGSKVGVLPVGRRVRLETLLYGLLLPSGNDAAVALAEHVAGSVPRFVSEMNAQAARLRLRCTHFASPDGLEDSNRSCAADLATLALLDLDEPRIARVAASASAILPLPIKGGRVYLYNNNPLLRYGYPGAIGLKTGETEAAGLCLVGAARRGRVRLGVVLLHSPELGRQAEALLDGGFHDVNHLPLLPAPPVPRGR